MKTNKLQIMITSIVIGVLFSMPCQARILRVNNGGSAYILYSGPDVVYSNLQTAIDASAANDTIHVEASSIEYRNTTGGPITVTRKLVIIGPGYLFGGGTIGNSGLQANQNTAIITDIFFEPGSEGSVIMGVQIGTGAGTLRIRTSNITVKRNRFVGALWINNAAPISGLLIAQNYFENLLIHRVGSGTVSSSIISNNRFGAGITLLEGFTGTVSQNVFIDSQFRDIVIFGGCQFYNNILTNGTGSEFAANNNSDSNIYNNVFSYAAPSFLLPTGTTNKFGVVNIFTTDSGSPDFKLTINPLCTPCLTGSTTGGQMGVFGGAPGTTYKLSGVPAIPAIYSLTAPSSAAQGSTIQVNVKTRSNN